LTKQKADRIKVLRKKYRELLEKYEPVVMGEGNPDAEIFMVGEAPGRTEIDLGRPFVGQAGKNLDEFLEILQISREDMYLTNAVKFRPTRESGKTGRISNRPPTVKEIELFRPLLMEEIEIVNPSIVITLGNIPLFAVTGSSIKIGDVHGEVLEYGVKILYPMYHPASIIYRRELKEVYERDLLKLKSMLTKRDGKINKR
jgi:DNA polymerase